MLLILTFVSTVRPRLLSRERARVQLACSQQMSQEMEDPTEDIMDMVRERVGDLERQLQHTAVGRPLLTLWIRPAWRPINTYCRVQYVCRAASFTTSSSLVTLPHPETYPSRTMTTTTHYAPATTLTQLRTRGHSPRTARRSPRVANAGATCRDGAAAPATARPAARGAHQPAQL